MLFTQYKNLVLSKTSGANIHKIHGLLGIILNQQGNYDYWQLRNDIRRSEKCKKDIQDAMKDIHRITGIGIVTLNKEA